MLPDASMSSFFSSCIKDDAEIVSLFIVSNFGYLLVSFESTFLQLRASEIKRKVI